jgi:hypothetical protein
MSDKVQVVFNVKVAPDGLRWAELKNFGHNHQFIAEHLGSVQQYSFAGGHGHRKITLIKDVHWLLKESFDITKVAPPVVPDTGAYPQQPKRRHHK